MMDSNKTFSEVVVGRRSIRVFKDTPVPRHALESALTYATFAPSAHNRQPWRFAVITDKEQKVSLANSMGQRLKRERVQDGDDQTVIEKDLAQSFTMLTKAGAIILLCLTMEDMDSYPDAPRNLHERHMAIQSVAMAGQNLLLGLQAEGLGACWMCAPLFAPEEVAACFDLPTSWEPQGLIVVGYPLKPALKKDHKSTEELIKWL